MKENYGGWQGLLRQEVHFPHRANKTTHMLQSKTIFLFQLVFRSLDLANDASPTERHTHQKNGMNNSTTQPNTHDQAARYESHLSK